MRSKKTLLSLPVILIVFISIACNLPGISAPTPFLTPTPNLTLTAIFDVLATISAPTQSIPSATTTQALVWTDTPVPTSTLIPPTAIILSTATNTPIPPTITTAPTNTPVSLVGPDRRPGPSIIAYYLQNEPAIDGVFDDWDLERYTISNVVFGANRWSGADDLSARVMLGWDDHNFYIAARVVDDVYVQGASEEDLFKGDSLEILIDTRVSRDYHQASLSSDDYQLGISPGQPTPGTDTEAYLWYPTSREGSQVKVKIGVTSTDNGYRIEVRIPWEIFGITPDIGDHYGFAISVSDNDRSGQNVQQSMISSAANRVLTDPRTWGDLVLMGQP